MIDTFIQIQVFAGKLGTSAVNRDWGNTTTEKAVFGSQLLTQPMNDIRHITCISHRLCHCTCWTMIKDLYYWHGIEKLSTLLVISEGNRRIPHTEGQYCLSFSSSFSGNCLNKESISLITIPFVFKCCGHFILVSIKIPWIDRYDILCVAR